MGHIEEIEQMLQHEGDDAFLLHALGLEYVKLDRDDKARVCFERVLQTDENYVGTYYHLAKLLERMNERQQAISTYDKGMLIATQQKNTHAFSELQQAKELFLDNE